MTEEQRDLEYVMERYGRVVNGVIASLLRDPSEREDVFQEVFLLYYTKELHFTDETARRSWLIRTAVNLCRAANRSPWSLLRSGELFDPDSVPDGGTPADNSELWRAVRRLKEKYRLPIYLHYFEEIPVHEIAELMKISEGAVKMRLKRGREKLKEELEAAENDDTSQRYHRARSPQP